MKNKKNLFNFLSDFLPQILIAILGIFKIKFFLQYLGDDTLGLYQLYSQLFSYLAIIEIGISSGVLYSLYKPTVEKDSKKLKKLYNGADYSFKIIGTAIIALGCILSLFVKFFIKDNSFSMFYLALTFILYIFSNVFNYYFMPKKLLFYAKEKNYIPNLIYQIFTIIKSILEIILVIMGFDLIIILLLGVIVNLLTNLLLDFLYRKEFNNLEKTKEKEFDFLKNLKSIIVHKLANLISSNIDIILISKFIGLSSVVIYTTYQYIILSIQLLTDKISNSILPSVGNILIQNKNEAKNIFIKFNEVLYFVAIVICVPLYFAINSFITIWYNNQIYTSQILAILFTLLLFINIVKQNSNLFVNAAGLFKETRICSIIDIALNLTLSIILVNVCGIPGVLFATVISLIITEIIHKNTIVLKITCNENFKFYFKISSLYYIILLTNTLIINILFASWISTNIFIWLIYGLLIFIINLTLTIIEINFINKNSVIYSTLKEILNKIKKKTHQI